MLSRRRCNSIRFQSNLGVFLFCLLCAAAHAQESTQQDLGEGEKAKVQIKSLKITGNTAISTEELNSIVRPHLSAALDLAALQKIAKLITGEYVNRGYILARAYVPQQEVHDGVAEVDVLEGKVREILVEGNKYYSTDFIRRAFARVFGEKAFRQDLLEKTLLLLNDYPDLKATALLQSGTDAGTTDIVVHVEDQRPIHLLLDYNNFGSEFVSRHRFGAEVNVGNVIIEGSSLSIRGLTGSKPADFLYGRTFYSAPVNGYDTKLGFGIFGGNFDVGREFAKLDINGKIWGYDVSLSHPLIKSRFQILKADFAYESKDTQQFLLGSLSSRDKIRMLRAGLSYENVDSTGRNFVTLGLFQGLGHAFGAMENNDPRSSRLGADNRFTRFNLNLARLQRIHERMSLILRAAGQTSTDSLVAGEQFSLGGPDTVRGYPQGEVLGDDAYNVSAEVRLSPLPNKEIAQLAFFIDHGAVSIKKQVPGQSKYDDLTGAGVGVRLYLPYNVNFRFDVGFPIKPSRTSSGDRHVFYLQAGVKF